MKMAKKVLSVVLAVLMALSCFAVASSAYTGLPYDEAEKHATIWMTAGLDEGSAKSTVTSNTKFSFNDPDDISLTEVTAEGGDTVYVYLYATADYYVEQFTCDIFMPADWQTPSEVLHSISGQASKNWSASNKKKIFYNEDHELLSAYPVSSTLTVLNESHNFVESALTEVKAWPTNADGSIVAKYANADGTPNTSKWKFVRFNQMADGAAEYAVMPQDEETYIIRIPIKIPADVADGTYQILIPEEAVMRQDKPRAYDCVTEMLDAEDGYEEDEIYDERIGNKWMYDAEGTFQYIDYSGACITVTIGEEAPTLIYTALDEAIADFEALTESDWTAQSWAAADAKYDAAVAAKTDATTQAEIDTAAQELAAAIDALEEAAAPLDYSPLEDALEAAHALTPDDYTIASWTVVNSKIDDYTGFVATTQAEINAAAADLTAALNDLVLAADFTALRAALAAYNAADEAEYDSAVWANIVGLVETGEEYLLDDLSIEDQSVVDALANAINNALANKLDKTALEAAIAEAEDILNDAAPDNYTADSWTAFTGAKDAADAAMSSTSQAAINDAATALTAAIAGLTEADADYTALTALIAEADALKAADYKSGWDAFTAALTDAKAVPTGLKAKDQKTIDDAKDALDAAIAALVPYGEADTSALVDAMAAQPDYALDMYKDTTALTAAKAAGQAILDRTDLTEADNEDIAAAAQAITDAIAALELKDADTTALQTAIEKANAVSANLVESKADLDAAVEAAETLLNGTLTILDQNNIDNAAAAINDAYDALVWLGADYTALNDAKAAFEALVAENYDADDYAAVEALYDEACAVAPDLGKADQGTVDAAATALADAIAALEELDADYAALNTAITAAGKVKETTKRSATVSYNNYTDETWAAFATALAAANDVPTGLKKSQQATIDDAKDALVAAQAALEFAPVPFAAEASPVLANAEAKNEADYTADSWANLQNKVAALKADETALKMDNFTKFMQDITAVNTAIRNLVEAPKAANYDELDAAIAEADEIDTSVYTDESVAAFAAALAAAKEVARDLTADEQATIDDAKDALVAAQAALELKPELANYDELDAAIADAEAVDTSVYTDETVADFAAALAAAKAVARDLTADDQATIDDAKDALVAAQAALELKPVEPAKGDVQKVELVGEPVVAGQAGTYNVTVNDRAMMVQFVESDHGDGTGTRTFDRYNENVEITSYKYVDGVAVECNNLDKDLAFEVWTITTPLADGNVDVRVKANGKSAYESMDVALRFVNEYAELDNEIISAELAKTEGKKGAVKYTVVAGADVQAIQFKNQEGETFTVSADKATVNADGTLTFTGNVWFHSTGVRTAALKALDANNGWVDTGIVLEYNINA